MATLLKRNTGIYAVQFYDRSRTPTRKWVTTGVREGRAAERIRQRWEAAYAEGVYDPWRDQPPVPSASPRGRRAPSSRLGTRGFPAGVHVVRLVSGGEPRMQRFTVVR
ncbi:hypothetical protein [Rubricoccus marinus]|nr:hypothetical protein [Rubricoccus marinus]